MGKRRWLIPLSIAAGAAGALVYRRLDATDGFQRFARPYDTFFSSALGPFYDRVARETAAVRPNGAVLDVGCGPGRLAVHLARTAPDLSVTGIDIAPTMIQLATQRAASSGLAGRVHFEVADVGALPFPDRQFDLVVSTLSMHHWPNQVQGLTEVLRVLKPGGRACIYDIADWSLRAIHHGSGAPSQSALPPSSESSSESFWKLGPIPVLERLCLRRKQDSNAE